MDRGGVVGIHQRVVAGIAGSQVVGPMPERMVEDVRGELALDAEMRPSRHLLGKRLPPQHDFHCVYERALAVQHLREKLHPRFRRL